MKKIFYSFPLLILFLLSFIVRLSLIGKGPYNVDCLVLIQNADTFLKTHELPYFFGTGYPLHAILGAAFLYLARMLNITNPVIPINFMSIFFSTLSVFLFYSVTKRMINQSTAFIATALFSFSPIFLGISVYGMNHAASMFFLLAGILFIFRYYESMTKVNLLMSAICIGLMGSTRFQDMILTCIPVTCILLFDFSNQSFVLRFELFRKKILKLMGYWSVVLFVVLLFHLPYFLGNNSADYFVQLIKYKEASVTPGRHSFYFLSILRLFITNFSIYGLIFAVIGGVLLYSRKTKMFILIFLWILFPLLFLVKVKTLAPRFLTILLPPLYIALGYFFSHFLNFKRHIRGCIFIVFILLLSTNYLRIYPILLYRHQNATIPEHAQWVASVVENNARVIVSDDSRFYIYYGHLHLLDRPFGDYHISEKALSEFKNKLDKLLEKDIPVYITDMGLYTYNPYKSFTSLVKSNFELRYVGSHVYEPWYSGELVHNIMNVGLYQIKQK